MASVWTGAITFSLVNIPVALRSAVKTTEDISFRMIHEKDGSPIEFRRFCKKEGQEVPWEEIGKGYEYAKGKYLMVSEEDIAKATLPTSKTFEIEEFVDASQLDPRFYEKPYIVLPRKEGESTYALLRDAMKEEGKIGIGRITLRKRPYIAALRPVGDALLIELLHYADEVVGLDEFSFPAGRYRDRELQMARQLVQNLSEEEFDIARYRDEYRTALEKVIRAKLKGQKLEVAEPEEPEPTGVIDLMERLQQSLQQSKPAAKKSGGARKRATRKKSA